MQLQEMNTRIIEHVIFNMSAAMKSGHRQTATERQTSMGRRHRGAQTHTGSSREAAALGLSQRPQGETRPNLVYDPVLNSMVVGHKEQQQQQPHNTVEYTYVNPFDELENVSGDTEGTHRARSNENSSAFFQHSGIRNSRPGSSAMGASHTGVDYEVGKPRSRVSPGRNNIQSGAYITQHGGHERLPSHFSNVDTHPSKPQFSHSLVRPESSVGIGHIRGPRPGSSIVGQNVHSRGTYGEGASTYTPVPSIEDFAQQQGGRGHNVEDGNYSRVIRPASSYNSMGGTQLARNPKPAARRNVTPKRALQMGLVPSDIPEYNESLQNSNTKVGNFSSFQPLRPSSTVQPIRSSQSSFSPAYNAGSPYSRNAGNYQPKQRRTSTNYRNGNNKRKQQNLVQQTIYRGQLRPPPVKSNSGSPINPNTSESTSPVGHVYGMNSGQMDRMAARNVSSSYGRGYTSNRPVQNDAMEQYRYHEEPTGVERQNAGTLYGSRNTMIQSPYPSANYGDGFTMNSDFSGRAMPNSTPQGYQHTPANPGSLQPVASLPDKFRHIYPFPYFNVMQSKCFHTAYETDDNFVVCAPTGSGKTAVMELAMLRLLSKPFGDSGKIVYMAPTKALCSERYRDWNSKFSHIGLICHELTGDTENSKLSDVQRSNLIITTPEKWDSTTRRWMDYRQLVGLIRLFLIDEVHILNEPERGSTLEVVISRMKTISLQLQHPARFGYQQKRIFSGGSEADSRIRFVAISATVPNVDDICDWLRDPVTNSSVSLKFGDEVRPVPLEKHVIGYQSSGNPFQFESFLDYNVPEVIEKYSSGKPTLVFCSTWKSVVSAAERMKSHMNVGNYNSTTSIVSRLNDRRLADLMSHRIGYHYGGLNIADRKLVEKAFIEGSISVLFTTSTLAVGVNLPARLVIIKGINQWSNNGWIEYSDLNVLQMMGRAGRPQFDDRGVAVIMCPDEKIKKYETVSNGTKMIESSLHENLIEHLNAEVALGSVKSKQLAQEWLKSSFLWIRIRKNPNYYKLQNEPHISDNLSPDNKLENITLRDLSMLREEGMVTSLDDSMSTLSPTEIGNMMARYYIKFKTASLITRLPPGSSFEKILYTPCEAEEFHDVRYRGDKQQLNLVNKEKEMLFPINGKCNMVSDKIYILIQANLGGVDLDKHKSSGTWSLEINSILTQMARISRFASEVFMIKRDLAGAQAATHISRASVTRCWDNTANSLRQVEGIGPQMTKQFAQRGINSISKLMELDGREIENICNRNPPFGNKVWDWLDRLPKFSLSVRESRVGGIYKVYINVKLDNIDKVRSYTRRGQMKGKIMIGTTASKFLILHQMFTVQQLVRNDISLSLPKSFNRPSRDDQLLISVISDDISGIDISQIFPIDNIPVNPNQNIYTALGTLPTEGSTSMNVPHTSQQQQQQQQNFSQDSDPISLDDETLSVLNSFESAHKKPQNEERPSPLTTIAENYANLHSSYSLPKESYNNSANVEPVYQRQSSNLYEVERVTNNNNNNNNNEKEPMELGRYVPCAHKCKDKSSCTHKCCKIGIPIAVRERRERKQREKLGLGNKPSDIRKPEIYDDVFIPGTVTQGRVQRDAYQIPRTDEYDFHDENANENDHRQPKSNLFSNYKYDVTLIGPNDLRKSSFTAPRNRTYEESLSDTSDSWIRSMDEKIETSARRMEPAATSTLSKFGFSPTHSISLMGSSDSANGLISSDSSGSILNSVVCIEEWPTANKERPESKGKANRILDDSERDKTRPFSSSTARSPGQIFHDRASMEGGSGVIEEDMISEIQRHNREVPKIYHKGVSAFLDLEAQEDTDDYDDAGYHEESDGTYEEGQSDKSTTNKNKELGEDEKEEKDILKEEMGDFLVWTDEDSEGTGNKKIEEGRQSDEMDIFEKEEIEEKERERRRNERRRNKERDIIEKRSRRHTAIISSSSDSSKGEENNAPQTATDPVGKVTSIEVVTNTASPTKIQGESELTIEHTKSVSTPTAVVPSLAIISDLPNKSAHDVDDIYQRNKQFEEELDKMFDFE